MTITAVACKTGWADSGVALAAYTVKRWVAVGASGTVIYSTNGLNWYSDVLSGTGNDLYAVSYNGSRFLSVGASGTIIYYISGVSWSTAADSGSVTTLALYSVVYNSSRWGAVGNTGTFCLFF